MKKPLLVLLSIILFACSENRVLIDELHNKGTESFPYNDYPYCLMYYKSSCNTRETFPGPCGVPGASASKNHTFLSKLTIDPPVAAELVKPSVQCYKAVFTLQNEHRM